jgi:copper oxidase (laccase) domain-containing protein
LSFSKIRPKENHIGGLTYFTIPGFPAGHAFFTRNGGNSTGPYAALNTAVKTEDPCAASNRKFLFETMSMEEKNVVILRPDHGQHIEFIDTLPSGNTGSTILKNTDAAFTVLNQIVFFVSSADCLILTVTDTDRSFVGIIHLGWRNLVRKFGQMTMNTLINRYEVNPEKIIINIGPCIYPCCYVFENPSQKADPFWQPFLACKNGGFYSIDLVSAAKKQLSLAGIFEERILETGLCTGCRTDLFFSCYKEGYVSGRFPTICGLKNDFYPGRKA